ncbi:MAG: chloramphenicol acetyltransferase [Pseudomonadota bacterium]|nr:chloramphenicol acetyltransferase [Pseudomonadota bacterium]
MARLKADAPVLHDNASVVNSDIGAFCEVGEGARLLNSTLGDYSYCERFCDIANTTIGKFANIASFVRIGATDHPLNTASLHHFLYRSGCYWDDAEHDQAFFEHRASRRATLGHDIWVGHGAMIKPEVTIGHGAVIAAGAIVTKDVAPYTIVAGTPAKVLRLRQPAEIAERMIALAWWDWDHEQIRAALQDFRGLSAEAFLEKYER